MPSAATPEAVRLIYQELCRSHCAIADFRAKLLALLPLASAGGIVLLLDGRHPAGSGQGVCAVGLYGFAVTVGLFMYELRGIEDCILLRARAQHIEAAHDLLALPEEASQFRGRGRGHLNGLVDEIGAGLIVYPAVMAAWLYVAGRGANLDGHLSELWALALAPLYLGVVCVAWRRFRPEKAHDPLSGRKDSAALARTEAALFAPEH
jgi:hypothetical protein